MDAKWKSEFQREISGLCRETCYPAHARLPIAGAAQGSPRTTRLYDRTGDRITPDEVERITI